MMSAYDRWATQGPPEYDEPELTGLAAEAQALIERLWDASVDLTEIGERRYARVIARAEKRVERRIQADAKTFWPNHYAMCDADELDYLEHEAREQGEADVMAELQAIELAKGPQQSGLCWCITWHEEGFTGACPDCRSTGNDLRGCDDCRLGHDIQACPAIKTLLMQEDT